MRHYVYIVQDSSTGRLYIGCRSCEGSPVLDPYMGSFHDSSFNPDTKWVWAEFKSKTEAYRVEEILHRLFNVVKSSTFVNRRVGSGAWSSERLTWWTDGVSETLAEAPPLGWRKGRKLGVCLNVQNRGRPWLYKDRHSTQSKQKMSLAHKGKKLAKEHKEKLGKITAGSRWAHDANGNTKRIPQNQPLPKGYKWGRKLK